MRKKNEKDPDRNLVQNRMDLHVSALDVADQSHAAVDRGFTEDQDPEAARLVLIVEDVAVFVEE